MARLIDADALKISFDERQSDDIEKFGCHIVECFPADDAKEIVDKAPTVDAVEVVHAYWTGSRFNPMTDEYEEYCSHCYAWSSEYGKPYCPNCGSRMDGDGNGNL